MNPEFSRIFNFFMGFGMAFWTYAGMVVFFMKYEKIVNFRNSIRSIYKKIIFTVVVGLASGPAVVAMGIIVFIGMTLVNYVVLPICRFIQNTFGPALKQWFLTK